MGCVSSADAKEQLLLVQKNDYETREVFFDDEAKITDSDLHALIDALKTNTRVNVFHITDRPMSQGTVDRFAAMLKVNQHLVSVALFGTPLTAAMAESLAGALKTHPMAVLNLNFTELDVAGARAILTAIGGWQNLATLKLSTCPGVGSVVELLRPLLGEGSSMTEMQLDNCELAGAPLVTLLDCLKSHPYMKLLRLNINEFKDADCDALTNFISSERPRILKLELGAAHFDAAHWKALVDAVTAEGSRVDEIGFGSCGAPAELAQEDQARLDAHAAKHAK